MSEQEPQLQQLDEQQHDWRAAGRRFIVGAVAAGTVFVGWSSLPDFNGEPGESAPTPSASPSPDEGLSELPFPVASPSPSSATTPTPPETTPIQEVLTGRPTGIEIFKLRVDAGLDYSDGFNQDPNECERYNNPCASQAESYLNEAFNVGVPGVDTLAQLTLHTSYNGEDIGGGLIDNPIDRYAHTGLQLGDEIVFNGFEGGKSAVARVIEFPDEVTIGQSVPNSPAVFIDKQEGLPASERALTGEFVLEVFEAVNGNGKYYALVGNSYAGTGENGFEISPDGSGRKYSGYLLVEFEQIREALSILAPELNDVENSAVPKIRNGLN